MPQYPATKAGKFMTTGNPNIKVGKLVDQSNLEGSREDKKSPHFSSYPKTGTEIGMVAEKKRKVLKQT